MTDNEIIKALECCCEQRYMCPRECPLYNVCDCGEMVLEKKAIDLINRQKAEIERLKEKVNKQGLVAQVIIDDEKMEEIKNDILEQIEYNIKEIKSEAYKEFAERLKKKIHKRVTEAGQQVLSIEPKGIDNLVKEMTEGAE